MTPTYFRTRRLFLSCLGAIYAIAFASFARQVEGLIGAHGIAPAASWLARVEAQLGARPYAQLPTLAWWWPSDHALWMTCAAGVVAGLCLMIGLWPKLSAFVAWALYLSMTTVGSVFLRFQWDILLLETGLLAVLWAPWGLFPRSARPSHVSRGGLFLLRYLLFRLMFLSGAVKWLSGDAAWHHFTALRYHYFTQPLPTRLGYFAHHLPDILQTLSCIFMFCIELGAPFFVFGPRRLRQTAGVALIALQILILTTGNYGYFNLLALALCIPLFDDAALSRLWRGRPLPLAPTPPRPHLLRRAGFLLLAIPLVIVETAESVQRLWPDVSIPQPVVDLERDVAPLRSVGAYGLFAIMTTERPEIVVEGSNDGVAWRAYAFRYKPGALDVAPSLVAPHMPRLDWQMWFAALGTCDGNRWFQAFENRLLEGSPDVLGLLANNPFPDAPPQYLRTRRFLYHYSSLATWWRTGDYWERTETGEYCPAVSRNGDEMR